MAVGSTADFDLTRNQLIDRAFKKVGVEEATTDQINDAAIVLNVLIRHLDARGQWLWAIDNTESTLTLVSSQQEYATGATSTTIATNILRLEYAAVLNGTDRKPLTILDKATSLRTHLQDDTSSEPVAVHLERKKLLTDNIMLFYPTPNSAYSVVYKYRRPLFDFDATTDNPDVPGEFVKPLISLLAVDLGEEYGMPLQERQLLEVRGERQFDEARGFHASRSNHEPVETEYF